MASQLSAEGGGYARSTDDIQDNITCKEGRGITYNMHKKRNELTSRESVRLLQLKLYLKAKQEKEFKLYALYYKIFLSHTLQEAYRRCKAKGGSAGIDKQTFADVETYGRVKFLEELQEELRTRKYKPQAVKRVLIGKENRGKRPLGIPTIKDRVAQQAFKML